MSKTFKNIATIQDIRDDLYHNGFYCDGRKYIRWKRSSGSARVGKCLFIYEALYELIRNWETCNIDYESDDGIQDLAGFESYVSLTSSSIIDTIKINKENILVIDDYDSKFEEDVVNIEEIDGKIVASDKRTTIVNSIWDGQSLIDISIMGKYSGKGMVLLRNRFFKSCCFNTNIQQWFKDNNITDIDNLNGFTLAKNIKDIKLITTPNSIKFLKFGTLDKWFDMLEESFGLVKHEKPTHFLEGKLVQTHYQLINTIQLSKNEVNLLLKPTFNFLTNIKSDKDILRYWINHSIEDEIQIEPLKSKTDVIYKMMSINDKFYKTKLYYDFRCDFIRSFIKNLKCGHILIEGNYSTLCGNPIEMLQHSINQFHGESLIGVGNVYNTRFKFGDKLLGSRSPHISISNVLLTNNVYNELIDKYMNSTEEIIYINSINENILQRLAGCDFDSDTILLTNNPILIAATEKYIDKFKVAVCNIYGIKTKTKYNSRNCAILDVKTSKNLIGEIINLSQELNTLIWDSIARKNKTWDEIQEIYLDICKLSVMSNLEIDAAKKEFNVNNSEELKEIKNKYSNKINNKYIKPNFFAHISKQKGFYNTNKKHYKKYHTSMDYLQECVNSFALKRPENKRGNKIEFMPFSEVVNQENFNYDMVEDKLVHEVIDKIEKMNLEISAIYADKNKTKQEAYVETISIRQDIIEEINKINFNNDTMIALLKTIEKEENKKYRRSIFYILFGYPNAKFYEVIINSKDNIKCLQKNINGDIDIFGEKFLKV